MSKKAEKRAVKRREKARNEQPEPVESKASARLLYRFLFHLSRPLFRLLFKLKIRHSPELKKEQGPCLILANHLSYLDVLPVAYGVGWREINFVAGKELFYKPILGGLLRTIQAIPKEQFYPDPSSIGQILRILKKDGVCILFPEGQRSYTGAPLKFSAGAAKLVKKLKIPVYTLRIKGAALAWPRWADSLRPGKIEVEVENFMSPEEIKESSVGEIGKKLAEAIYHNEYEWQAAAKKPHRYRSKKLAEGLEKIIYYCPLCQSELGFKSKGRKIFCLSCNGSFNLAADYTLSVASFGEGRAQSKDSVEAPEQDSRNALNLPSNPYLWTLLQAERRQERGAAGADLYRASIDFCQVDSASREAGELKRAELIINHESIRLEVDGAEAIDLKSSGEGNTYVSLGNFVQLFGPEAVVYRLIPGSPAEVYKIVEALQLRAENL